MAEEKLIESKPWYLSKGIMGSAGGIIAMVLGLWYTDVKADDITAVLIGAGGVISSVLGLYGRLAASKKIG